MNFDQKAVKFLANFYMNGGQHWTHGGIQTRQPTPPSGRKLARGHPSRPLTLDKWESAKLPAPQNLQNLRMGGVTLVQDPELLRIRNVKDFSKCRAMWDVGFERRPPILIDMDTPGPTQYSVPDVSIRESSPHPQYSIRCKTPPRDGGGRRAWQTAWFQSESPFTQKADFLREKKIDGLTPPHLGLVPKPDGKDSRQYVRGPNGVGCSLWPSPFHYTQPCSLGPQQPSRPSFPAFTFGHRRLRKCPSPNTYNVVPGFQLKGTRSPAFSMSRAQALNTWISPAHTPGPAAYYVEDSYNSRYPSTPGVLIQGERRPKRHETGPFCSL
ncbi:LOW QUALITY PROTEIN: protein STPG3 [Gracilinanus agilis]|uniref:LOW QUALITY PROTEIN: protein STPG3 n=1 Tax=Gracilinanus agilis TaxID=191870 RepID=UPI001CFE2B33|nr:LOW QUALITY PROTEIN: protein STPG3 [Gracilinanus agilis]